MPYFYIYAYNIIYLQNVAISLISRNVIDFHLMEEVYCKIYLHILALISKVDDAAATAFGSFFRNAFGLGIYSLLILVFHISCIKMIQLRNKLQTDLNYSMFTKLPDYIHSISIKIPKASIPFHGTCIVRGYSHNCIALTS